MALKVTAMMTHRTNQKRYAPISGICEGPTNAALESALLCDPDQPWGTVLSLHVLGGVADQEDGDGVRTTSGVR